MNIIKLSDCSALEPRLTVVVPQVLTHQKWSGANYADNLLTMLTGGISSTAAMGKGVTEDQFKLGVGDHGHQAEEKK